MLLRFILQLLLSAIGAILAPLAIPFLILAWLVLAPIVAVGEAWQKFKKEEGLNQKGKVNAYNSTN